MFKCLAHHSGRGSSSASCLPEVPWGCQGSQEMTMTKTAAYNSVGLVNLGWLGDVSHSILGEALQELFLVDISEGDLTTQKLEAQGTV